MSNFLICLLAHSVESISEKQKYLGGFDDPWWELIIGFVLVMTMLIAMLCLQSLAHGACFQKFSYIEKVNRKEHAARKAREESEVCDE